MKTRFTSILALSAALAAPALSGQVVFTSAGDTYSQNFSSLSTTTNVAQDWENNVTLPGWYARQSGGDFTSYTPSWQTGISAGVLYHARNTEETNRSFLGGRVTSGTGDITVGFRLNNDTGATLTSFDLSFIASQFFKTGVAQQMQVSFSTDATSLTTGTWTVVPSLTYTVPYTTGNATVSAAEEIASRATLSVEGQAVSWDDGDDLWIRFISYRDLSGFYSGAAGVIAITDVSFSAIPEPSTYAALIGLLTLAFVAARRRRTAR